MHRTTRSFTSALTLTVALLATACAAPDDDLEDRAPVGNDQDAGKADIVLRVIEF